MVGLVELNKNMVVACECVLMATLLNIEEDNPVYLDELYESYNHYQVFLNYKIKNYG